MPTEGAFRITQPREIYSSAPLVKTWVQAGPTREQKCDAVISRFERQSDHRDYSPWTSPGAVLVLEPVDLSFTQLSETQLWQPRESLHHPSLNYRQCSSQKDSYHLWKGEERVKRTFPVTYGYQLNHSKASSRFLKPPILGPCAYITFSDTRPPHTPQPLPTLPLNQRRNCSPQEKDAVLVGCTNCWVKSLWTLKNH